ncbi:hypothetical protein MES4922_470026 [Mesorhizobium ventifaucium]|uniref:Uncharacterized protein n=1 Tax=Mesorhizobium ventifaucium TaxID=666020 RepID=A0ABM9E9T8_9HYPH|nr:hypothetical protein MES4922_470026 [Mesorhizobium ventifaucium]
MCAFYRIIRAGGEAGPGSSFRDGAAPVFEPPRPAGNGSQPSLSTRYIVLIWYYQFRTHVKLFLGRWQALRQADYSNICLFFLNFPTR